MQITILGSTGQVGKAVLREAQIASFEWIKKAPLVASNVN